MENQKILYELLDGINSCSEQLKIIQLRLRTYFNQENKLSDQFESDNNTSIKRKFTNSDIECTSIESLKHAKLDEEKITENSIHHRGKHSSIKGRRWRGRPKKLLSMIYKNKLELTDDIQKDHKNRGRSSKNIVDKEKLSPENFIDSKRNIELNIGNTDFVVNKSIITNRITPKYSTESSSLSMKVPLNSDFISTEQGPIEEHGALDESLPSTRSVDQSFHKQKTTKNVKWWYGKKVFIEWRDPKNYGVQQNVNGRLFDEEPRLGETSLVKWSKPSSQRKYPAFVIEILQ